MSIPSAPPGIDLHAHTTASDGSLTPEELVARARALGLRALAVTDHDTLAGLAPAREAARRTGGGDMEIVPGIELSTEDADGRFHLLGYLFDPDSSVLRDTLEGLRRRRAERNARIMDKVRELNLPLTWNDVLAEVKDGGRGEDAVVGRPHIAAAMIRRGLVATTQEAFDRYLATGRPLYFSKHGLTPRDAAALLHQAGGVAVMAHPGLTRWAEPALLESYLTKLRDVDGLDGLEVYYSQHTPGQIEAYRAIAERLGLAMTGGSDFHGDPKPGVPLGVAVDGGPAPLHLLDALRAAALARRRAA